MTKLMVCGSRSIIDKDFIYEKIDECVAGLNDDVTIIEGEARGVDLCKEICSINHSDNRDVKHEDVLAPSFLFNSVVDFNPLEPCACFITCPSRSSINRELPKRNK